MSQDVESPCGGGVVHHFKADAALQEEGRVLRRGKNLSVTGAVEESRGNTSGSFLRYISVG